MNWKNREARSKYYKEYYQKNREAILKRRKKYREENKEKLSNYRRAYYQRNKEKEMNRAKEYYQKNKEYLDVQSKKWRIKRRMEVLIHYSGNPPKCACCGESHFEFLVIDHIAGGGTKHRKKANLMSASTFYTWLKENNFPKGFRVLCHNCNMARGLYGYCPHQRD